MNHRGRISPAEAAMSQVEREGGGATTLTWTRTPYNGPASSSRLTKQVVKWQPGQGRSKYATGFAVRSEGYDGNKLPLAFVQAAVSRRLTES